MKKIVALFSFAALLVAMGSVFAQGQSAEDILAKVIAEMLQEGLATRVRSEGRLIVAGIITDQEPEVVEAMEQQGLARARRIQREDWVCLVAERN